MTMRADCGTMEVWISESLDLELPEERRSVLAAHLAECPSCSRFMADLEEMTLEIRPPAPELQRLWSRLRLRAPKKAFPWLKIAAATLLCATSYAAGRLHPADGRPAAVTGPGSGASSPRMARERVLGDISARMTVAALVPGEGDPGSILIEETRLLVQPELIPSHD